MRTTLAPRWSGAFLSLPRRSRQSDCQGIVMSGDKSTQIRSDLRSGIESGGLRRSFLFLRRNTGAFCVVSQVAVKPDGEKIPRCALVAEKNQILRKIQSFRIGVFHLSLFVQACPVVRERDEHFDVKEFGVCKCRLQRFERRPMHENVFLPRNVRLDPSGDFRHGAFCLAALCDAIGAVVFAVAAHRIKKHQIPVVALAVTHPEGRRVAGRFESSGARLQERNQFKKLAGRRLYELRAIEISFVGCRSGRNCEQRCENKDAGAHERCLLKDGILRCKACSVFMLPDMGATAPLTFLRPSILPYYGTRDTVAAAHTFAREEQKQSGTRGEDFFETIYPFCVFAGRAPCWAS